MCAVTVGVKSCDSRRQINLRTMAMKMMIRIVIEKIQHPPRRLPSHQVARMHARSISESTTQQSKTHSNETQAACLYDSESHGAMQHIKLTGGPSEGSTPSGCYSPPACDHPPAACLCRQKKRRRRRHYCGNKACLHHLMPHPNLGDSKLPTWRIANSKGKFKVGVYSPAKMSRC